MALSFGIYTSDPNLLRCELARVRHDVPDLSAMAEPMGAGWFAEDSVLVQRYSAKARPSSLEGLGGVLESDSLLVHSAPLPLGLSPEENTPPFRYRQWMFAAQGSLGATGRFRNDAVDALPEHLARAVKGDTHHELMFAIFLSALRDSGRTDDFQLDPAAAAKVMGAAARRIEQLAPDSNGRGSGLSMIATNNRVMVAARLGEERLFYKLLEGAPTCDVCDLQTAVDTEAAARAHLRRRSVALTTGVRDPQGWIALEPGTAIAVGRNLHVERLEF